MAMLEFGERQPKLAKFRLDRGMLNEVGVEPPPGIIALGDKAIPVEEREVVPGEEFLVSRGKCDVTELANRLTEDVWTPDYARTHNVELERPSHDSWGIRKLCFVFCDDFMKRTYRLPLWFEWLDVLAPAFDACGCRPEKIVRCLLASMPPQTVIPVHHDSGYWVPRTRRLHCAVETNDAVVFRVGCRADAMRRFSLKPGNVVELNNQAKHYVANLSLEEYRTHLIFDYVEDDPPPCVDLKKGEVLVQTRRSIALKSERGTGPPAPHFLIIGAQKAATTAAYEYLCKHPLVIKGKRRETHFLDWRWPSSSATKNAWHETYFDVEEHSRHPCLVACDSTPSYLLNSFLAIPRLRLLKKQVPMIVMIRDPVERAASHFAMITDPRATPAQRRTRGTAWLGRTIADVALDELRDLVRQGLLVTSEEEDVSLTSSFRVDGSKLDSVLSKLPNSHGAHSLLLRGMYAIQLKPWLDAFPRSSFAFVKSEDLARSPHHTRDIVLQLQRHVGLRDHPLDLNDANAKHNTRPHDPLPPDIRRQLEIFYRPFNDQLDQLITEDDWIRSKY